MSVVNWAAGAAMAGAVTCLAIAAARDVAVRAVPNAVPLALAACGVALALLQHRLPVSVAVAGAALAVGVALWLRGLMGGADAKLLAACALLVPPAAVPGLVLAVALCGGALSLVYLPGRRLYAPAGHPAGRGAAVWRRAWRCERRRLRRRGPLPYAVAIAAGALFTLAGV